MALEVLHNWWALLPQALSRPHTASRRARLRAAPAILFLLLPLTGCSDKDVPTGLTAVHPSFAQVANAPVVNSVADPGDGTCNDTECTLREAIAFATAGAEITFDPALTATGSKMLYLAATSGALSISRNLTITGPGANKVIIRAPGSPTLMQVFSVSGGTVSISGLGITNGYHVYGGGVFISAGATVTLDACAVIGNTATSYGGGIENRGTLTVTNSEISVNQGGSLGAGGIDNQAGAVLTVTNSTIAGNQALYGAGIESRGTLIVTNSTISENTATGTGAGLSIDGGTLTMVNSTVTGNQAASYGGGIKIASSDARIILSTITGNRGGSSAATGGGGIYSTQSGSTQTYVKGSLIWGNTLSDGSTANDVAASSSSGFTSLGYNLVGAAGANVNFTVNFISTGDQTGVASAGLGALTSNGGPTVTHALLTGSPALDQIPEASCTDHTGASIGTDQRGMRRPQGSACDIGAYEKEVVIPQDPAAPVVNSNLDNGDGSCTSSKCTLRDAVAYASSGATITFAVTGDINLLSTLTIDKSLIIRGPGAESLSLRGQNSHRVIEIGNYSSAITVELHRMTVRDGRINNLNGGGMYITDATALLDSMVVRDNTITGSTSVFGAGISAFGADVTVRNSTITGNSFSATGSIWDGGGISLGAGTLTVENSAIVGNTAEGGGGLRVSNGVATVRNSTVSGNSASWLGGGVYISNGTLNVEFSTVAGNSALLGGGVYAEGGTITLSGAILADNTSTASGPKPDLADPYSFVTATHTLIESAMGHSFTNGDANGNIVGSDPGLGPLSDNGGFTPTQALATGSAAIDQVASGTIGCGSTVATDQRGVDRPQGANCDIGAYEAEPPPPPELVVNSPNDPGTEGCDATECTLREAIAAAEVGATISFSASLPATITLTSGLLTINKNLNISGPGAGTLAVSGNSTSQVFQVTGATVTLSGLAIVSGHNTTSGAGGVSVGTGGNLTVSDCYFSGNVGLWGGAIMNSNGTLLVARSTFATNSATSQGGALAALGGTTTVVNSTFSGNSVSGSGKGGAIYYGGGTARILHSTITGNTATVAGGGILGDFYTASHTVKLRNTIVWGNTAAGSPNDLQAGYTSGTYTSLGYNMLGVLGAGVDGLRDFSHTGDVFGITDMARLGTLQVNPPGETPTIELLTSSYAIDHGTCTDENGDPVATDQRGVARPQGSACDIGAYEKATGLLTPEFSFDLSTLPAKAYGDAPFSVAGYVSTNSSGTVTFALGAGSTGCSVSSAGAVTITSIAVDPSACIVEASLAADATFTAAGPISQSFHIAKGTPTVSIANLPSSATVGDGFTPTYTTTSDGAKSTTSSTTGMCTVNGATGYVSFIAAGTCTLVAHVAATANYLAADGAPQSVVVSPAAPIDPSLTFNLGTLPAKTYGDSPFSVADYTSSNSGGAITFALGSGSTGCSVTSAGMVTITGAAVDPAHCILEASQAAAAGYTADGPIPQSFNIAKAATTVSIGNAPASGSVGGGFTPTYTTTSDGTKSTTSSTPSVCTVSGGYVSYIAAGTCTLVAHVAEGTNWLAADGNNQSVGVSAPAPITPTFTFNLSSLSKAYGDEPFSPVDYINTNSTGAITFELGTGSIGCSLSGSTVTITGAAVDPGHCIIEASLAADGSYAGAGPLSQSFNIAKAALTVTANNQTITYLDATPSFGVGYSAFAGSDDATVLGGSLVYTFEGTGGTSYGSSTTAPTNAGTYSITPSGYTSANYSFSYVAGTFTINKATPDLAFAPGMPTTGTVGGGFTPTVEADGDGVTSVTSSTTGICTVDTATGYVSYSAAGTCTLTAHIAEGTNHVAADGNPYDIAVSPAAPITPNFVFSLSTLPVKTYGDASFSVASYATSNSTGAVTFALGSGSTGCSVTSEGDVTIAGAAVDPTHCIIEASQAAASGYTSAGPIPQSFNIAKAGTTVEIANLPTSGTVGGGFTPTYTTASDGATSTTSSTPSVCSVSGGDVSYIASGTCTLVAHVAEGTNYTAADGGNQDITVSAGVLLTPKFTFDLSRLRQPTFGDNLFSVAAKRYVSTNSTGAITFALGATSTGCEVSPAGDVTITGAAVDPAACVIEASLSADATFAAAGPISQSFHIAKAVPTVSISNIPVDAQVDGSFTPAYGTESDGTLSVVSATETVCTVSEGVVDFIAAGTCTVLASVDESENYLSATGGPQSFQVGGEAPEFSSSCTFSVNDRNGQTDITVSWANAEPGVTSILVTDGRDLTKQMAPTPTGSWITRLKGIPTGYSLWGGDGRAESSVALVEGGACVQSNQE